ncbi:DUF4391 domain-containing protein [Acidimicrobiales bacterium]|nr:DUF4391 domain-containing protein [Acidimicrobiales bacterium]
MNAQCLYRWPPAARFGRVVPKNKFFEHGKIATTVREKFVSEVQRITWAYKLADSTIHLRGTEAVPEIQVFVIDAKGDDVSDDVLAAIDKAVPFPIIFEINRDSGGEGQTRMAGCHKRLDGAKPQLSSYFSNSWLTVDTTRSALPSALDLASLYSGLLTPMLPVEPRAGERLSEATERVGQARKLQREIATLERRLRREPQLNRKVELRRELKEREARLAAVTDPVLPKPQNDPQKDTQWTS